MIEKGLGSIPAEGNSCQMTDVGDLNIRIRDTERLMKRSRKKIGLGNWFGIYFKEPK